MNKNKANNNSENSSSKISNNKTTNMNLVQNMEIIDENILNSKDDQKENAKARLVYFFHKSE